MQKSLQITNSMACLEAALTYASWGIPVFPVRGKVPFYKTQGFYDATCDPATIKQWWKHWPDANVAIPTGKRSGWVALDIDGNHGGFASFKQLQTILDHRHRTTLPKTLVAQTGFGNHQIFHPPASDDIQSTVQFAGLAGIDIRAEKAYIVVAPSLHPNGQRYNWLTDCQPAPFPYSLIELHRHQKQQQEVSARASNKPSSIPMCASSFADYWLEKAIAHARKGTRHRCALWLACRLLQQAHLSPSEASIYLQRYVERIPGGGEDYPLADALRCLAWAKDHVL